MSNKHKLFFFLAAFLIADIAVLYMVYQKYTQPDLISKKSFFSIEGRPFSYFINKDGFAPSGVFNLETPFFHEDVELSGIAKNQDNFVAMINENDLSATLNGKIEGKSDSARSMTAILTLFSGKFEHEKFAASRLSGNFELNETTVHSVLVGTMNIGRIKWGKIPLSGIQASLRGNTDRGDLNISGQVSGHEGTTFEADAILEDGALSNLRGVLTITNPRLFLHMLESINPDAHVDLTAGNTLLFRQQEQSLLFFYPEQEQLVFKIDI